MIDCLAVEDKIIALVANYMVNLLNRLHVGISDLIAMVSTFAQYHRQLFLIILLQSLSFKSILI